MEQVPARQRSIIGILRGRGVEREVTPSKVIRLAGLASSVREGGRVETENPEN